MSKIRKIWRQIKTFMVVVGIIVLIAAFMGGCTYVRWSCYHQRFPNASFWTMFFK